MSQERASQKIVIAGASSLLGGELKTLLEESRFAGWDLQLVDEEDAAGTLTEAGGEAAIIQRLEEGTFRNARYAFLAGSTAFGGLCMQQAREADSERAAGRDRGPLTGVQVHPGVTGSGVGRYRQIRIQPDDGNFQHRPQGSDRTSTDGPVGRRTARGRPE